MWHFQPMEDVLSAALCQLDQSAVREIHIYIMSVLECLPDNVKRCRSAVQGDAMAAHRRCDMTNSS